MPTSVAVAAHPALPTSLIAIALAVAWMHGWYLGRRRRRTHPDVAGSTVSAALAELRDNVVRMEERRAASETLLAHHIRAVTTSQSELVHALRTPHVRGRWGELHLQRAVELAGLTEHCDYEVQCVDRSDDGCAVRPDLVVRAAGGRAIVVDAKAPMDAWLTAMERSADDERLEHEQRHARAMRAHVRALAARDYGSAVTDAAPLVVLYLPGEDLLRAALEHDPRLIEDASQLDIVLATPSSLIAILRGVALGWREERLADHAAEITRLGTLVHDRIGIVTEHLSKLGRALDSSVQAYDDVVGSCNRRLIPAARGLRELDAAGTRMITPMEPIDRHVRRTFAHD